MKIKIDCALDFERWTAGVAIAGQLLTGRVCVYIRGGPVSGGLLTLHVTGLEYVRHGEYKREKIFFSKSIVLRDLDYETLQNGYSEIPFEIPIPRSLPSSTCSFGNTSPFLERPLGGNIFYEIGVKQDSETRGGRCFRLDAIAPPSPAGGKSHLWGPTARTITRFGLTRKGEISLAVYVHDTRIRRGGNLLVALACRNRSAVAIQGVLVDLVEETKYDARADRIFLVQLKDVNLPALEKDKKDRSEIGSNTKRRRGDGNDHVVVDVASENEKMKEDLQMARNTFEINIPFTCRDTIKRKFFETTHFLMVKLVPAASVGHKLVTKLVSDKPDPDDLIAKIPLEIVSPYSEPSNVFANSVPQAHLVNAQASSAPTEEEEFPIAEAMQLSG